MYEGARMAGPLDSLRVMQRRVCLWITGSFKTSPRGAAETLAGIPPIHLHVQKLVERSHVTGAKEIWCHPSQKPGAIWASPPSTWTLSTGSPNPACAQGTCSLDALSLTL
jgi:hypothetical protein